MVQRPERRLPPGTLVDVIDRGGVWVGRGFYNGHSRICIRLLSTQPGENVDVAFFARRLERAIQFRREILKLDAVTSAYRLVHSEGDELSGLVVDRFADLLVLEFFSAGMWRLRSLLQDCLATLLPGSRFYWFAEEHVQRQESFDCHAPPPPEPLLVAEHGLRFRITPGAKHKTGFFADQRDNRRRLADYCAGKRVLDLCCNSGGFAIYAKALGQAAEVIGLDVDEEVLELARQNGHLNQARIRWVQADLFPWLRDAIANDQRFDVVVLDPAKQTRDREAVPAALKKYLDMNKLALQVVRPGGLMLTCSCTGLVSEEDFLETIRRAAWQAQRTVQVFHLSGAAPDHPFLAHVREGRYLKAVWCRVY